MFFGRDKSLTTVFTPRPGAEGPKAHAHGGFLATILDETMGYACWMNGLPVLAANLAVKYRKSVPLNGSYTCTAQIVRLESRRAMVAAQIHRDGVAYCEATGVFVRVPIELLREQPDMARMVEVVESIKAGRSIEEYIALDRKRHNTHKQPTEGWQALLRRGENLLRESSALASDFLAAIFSLRF